MSIGTGVTVTSVVRIHDEFVFTKLRKATTDLAYDTYATQTLEEVAQYFPDLAESGISRFGELFFRMEWFYFNASEGSQKIALVQSAVTLTSDIKSTRDNLRTLQDSVNSQLETSINEINSLGQRLADLNKQIGIINRRECMQMTFVINVMN